MTDEPLNPREEEAEALKRIAATGDGHLLHRYLRRILEHVVDIPMDGALQSHNGRRSLARDLMRLMAEGLDDHRTDQHSTDHPILTRSAGGVAVSGRARRDSSRFPRVDSYGPDRNADGSPVKA